MHESEAFRIVAENSDQGTPARLARPKEVELDGETVFPTDPLSALAILRGEVDLNDGFDVGSDGWAHVEGAWRN